MAQMDGQRAQQYYGLSTSVVIPALNEAQNLQYVLPFIPPFVSEVILVNGHSTDDTFAVAKQLLPTTRIIKQVGKGKGNALKAGFGACSGKSSRAKMRSCRTERGVICFFHAHSLSESLNRVYVYANREVL